MKRFKRYLAIAGVAAVVVVIGVAAIRRSSNSSPDESAGDESREAG